MCYKISLCFLLILFLFINSSVQEPNSTDVNTTLTPTNKSTVLSCPGGHIDPPNCTKCASNYENKDDKCFEIKSELKPSRGIGRRIFFLFCLVAY